MWALSPTREQGGDPGLSGATEIASTVWGGERGKEKHWAHLPQAGEKPAGRRGLLRTFPK